MKLTTSAIPFFRSRTGSGLAPFAALTILFVTSASAQEWYDHYERGLAALRRRQPIVAAASFQRAIQRQPSPGENVLTYGTNRLPRYHPYVKLAEAQAMAGDFDLARRTLAQSEATGREPAAERALVLRLIEAATGRGASPAGDSEPVTPAIPPSSSPAPVLSPQVPRVSVESVPPTVAAGGEVRLSETRPAPSAAAVTPSPDRTPGGAEGPSLPAAAVNPRVDADGSRPATSKLPAEFMADAAPTPAPSMSSAAQSDIAEAPGVLTILTTPPGVDVYLDDEFIGRSDSEGRLVKRDVPPGRHELRGGNVQGYDDARLRFDLASDETRSVEVVLAVTTKRSPLVRALLAILGVLTAALLVWAFWRRGSHGPAPAASDPATRRGAAGSRPETQSARSPSLPNPGDSVATSAGASANTLRRSSGGIDGNGDAPTEALDTGPARAGSRFGEYRLIRELGRGGMAAVFLAEKGPEGGEQVALKRPLAAYLSENEFLERFMREAEIGRTLNHPNIIHILDRGRIGAVPYFTMELVKGETLHARLKAQGAFPARVAAQTIKQVSEALDYAHLKGVIHRDLKPSNIMILDTGVVKVMDYGIARSSRFEGLTVTGAFLGTPEYIAPETAEGGKTDARSDLYALGVIFYELVTGLRPFVGETPFATIRKHCTEPPRPPSEVNNCPDEIERIILRLLSKAPADRYASAEDLILDLNRYVDALKLGA